MVAPEGRVAYLLREDLDDALAHDKDAAPVLDQLRQMKKLGSLESLVGMLPGGSEIKPDDIVRRLIEAVGSADLAKGEKLPPVFKKN